MSRITEGKVVIFSAPSGAGKSTIIGRLLEKFPRLEFSISCTSRPPRGKEVHGRRVLFPQQRRVQSARGGRGVRRMGGGLSRNLLRHAAQRSGQDMGEGERNRFRRGRQRRRQSQENVRRKRPVRLHHAAFGRGAAAPARRPGNRLGRNDRKAGGQGPSRKSPMPRSSTG